MKAYLIRRLAYMLPLWVGLSLFSFGLGKLAPGDPAQALLRESMQTPPTDAQVERLRERLGLNDPAVVQYGSWVGNAVTGDLGASFRTGNSVANSIGEALPVTLDLTILSFAIAIVVAIPLGVAAALRRGGLLDHVSRVLALGAASMPSFVFGYLLIVVFAVKLHWFPTGGTRSSLSYVLPSLTLAIYDVGLLLRLTRASMLETLGEEFVLAARARGLSRFAVVVRHALRVAFNPVVTYAGLLIGGLLGGAVIVETIFAMPGMGKLVVDAINDRDFPIVQGFVLYFGSLVLVINLAVDLLYVALDPRVRLVETKEVAGHGSG